jgi:hypothetical protein
MAAIMMNQTFNSAIKSMCAEAVGQAINALAEKYSFDVDDAKRHVNIADLKIVSSTAKGKSTTKKASGDEKPKVKRGPTGYLLFAADARPGVKEEMTAELNEGEKLKPQAVVTAVAAKWAALSDEEKEVWKTLAKDQAPQTSSDGETSDSQTYAKLLAVVEAPTKAAPKTPTKAVVVEVKEPEKPKKKKTSGYLMFGQDQRPTIKAEMQAALAEGVKLKPQDVVNEIATRWKALDDDEKAMWNEQAKSDTETESD